MKLPMHIFGILIDGTHWKKKCMVIHGIFGHSDSDDSFLKLWSNARTCKKQNGSHGGTKKEFKLWFRCQKLYCTYCSSLRGVGELPGYLLDDWFLVDRTLSRMEGMKMGEGVTWDALSFLCLFWEKKSHTYTFVKIDMTKTRMSPLKRIELIYNRSMCTLVRREWNYVLRIIDLNVYRNRIYLYSHCIYKLVEIKFTITIWIIFFHYSIHLLFSNFCFATFF